MENRSYALFVGLFTLLLGGALLFTLWWFSGGAQDTRLYLIVSAQPVGGLNPQAAVRYRGVRVGKVVDIDLQDAREVYIQIRVDSEVPITRGTRARIGSQGLTGQGYIMLDDAGNDPAPPTRVQGLDIPVIALEPSATVGGAAESAQALVARLRNTTERIERVLSDENIARIDQTLQNLATSSARLDRTLTQSEALARDLRRFTTADNARKLDDTLAQVQGASAQLGPALADFRSAMTRVSAAGQRIDRLGESLQGPLASDTLPRINALMQELQTSSRQLSRVLDEVERSPQQFVLGKQPPAPGPGEKNP